MSFITLLMVSSVLILGDYPISAPKKLKYG